MNHTLIVKHALDVLKNPGIERNDNARAISVAALTAAAELDLAPAGTASALWSYLRGDPRGSRVVEAADVIGTNLPFEPLVYSQAVDVVMGRENEPRLYESCLSMLMGTSYACHVRSETLLGISECCSTMGRRVILMFPQVVEAVHEQGGGLPEEIIRALRDSWSRSPIEDQRFESPELARLLPKMDLDWLRMMLMDPSAQVRGAVALTIHRMAEPETSLPMLQERTLKERHHGVLSALHGAIEGLIREIERHGLRRR